MIKKLLSNNQILLGIIMFLLMVVALLLFRANAPQLTAAENAKQQDVAAATDNSILDFESDIDIGRRTVTVYDCGLLDDFEVMHKVVAVFKANAQKLFKASQLRQLNQKNTIRLDRINGNCKLKLGPIFNSPIAAN